MALTTGPRPLREKLGDEASDALVELINEAGNGYKQDTIALVSERFERRLAEEMGKLRQELGELRGEMGTELGKLHAEMAAMETRILRWQFAQWVTLLLFLMGILLTTLRH